jgi:hypothetical protein
MVATGIDNRSVCHPASNEITGDGFRGKDASRGTRKKNNKFSTNLL